MAFHFSKLFWAIKQPMASKRSDRYDHTLVACGHVRDAPSGLSTFRDNCRNNCFPCFASKKGNTHNEYSQPLLGKQGYKAIPNQVAVGEISCTSGLSPCGSTKRASESLLAANALSIEECRRKLGVRCRNGLPPVIFCRKVSVTADENALGTTEIRIKHPDQGTITEPPPMR